MSAIRTALQTRLEDIIDAMTTGGGFNFNYGPVDVIKHASRVYPQVFILFTGEDAIPRDDDMVFQQTNEWEVDFRVIVDDSLEVDTSMDKILHDFKKLFFDEEANLQTDGQCYADYIGAEREYTFVLKRPGIITLKFNIRYRQNQKDPNT